MLDQLRGAAQLIRTLRSDGWENLLTGLGTGRDKTQYGQFRPVNPISPQELSALYNHNDLAQRIVSIRPKEMLRQGFGVEIEDDSEGAATLNKEINTRHLIPIFKKALTFSRLHGGGLLLGGLDDGQSQDQPLDETRLQRLRYLTFLDRRYVSVRSYYEDPENEKFLEPETYQIVTPNGRVFDAVHESRCIRFGGRETDEETSRALGGWDFSILQSVYNTLMAFDANWQAINVLISDASQGVFTIKGFINSLASPNGRANMQTRMELIDMCRSVARAVVLDADSGEDFKRVQTAFTGLPELLDRGMMRLSAAAEVPVTILFGRSAAGENATGEGDFQGFYDSIAAENRWNLDPKLRRVVSWICLSKEGPTSGVLPDFTICFPPLWQMDPVEEATCEKTYAERDKLLIESEVWLPEEVALARSRGGSNGAVEINEEMREKMLENEAKLNVTETENQATFPAKTTSG